MMFLNNPFDQGYQNINNKAIYKKSRSQNLSLSTISKKKLLHEQLYLGLIGLASERSANGAFVCTNSPLLVLSLQNQNFLDIPQFAVDVFMAKCQVDR